MITQVQTINSSETEYYKVDLKYNDGTYFTYIIKSDDANYVEVGDLINTINLPIQQSDEGYTDLVIDVVQDKNNVDFSQAIVDRIKYLSNKGVTLGGKPVDRLLWLYDMYLYAFKSYQDDDILNIMTTLFPDDEVFKVLARCMNITPRTLYVIYIEYFKAYCKTVQYGGVTLYDVITQRLSNSPLIELWNSGKTIRTDNPLVLQLQSQLSLSNEHFYGIFQGALEFQLQNYL
ncbi:MAG: hypothetical protein QXE78_01890 [Nitrososphaeria archaeon]